MIEVPPSRDPKDVKTAALSQALAAAAEAGGDTVSLLPGPYYLDGPLVLSTEGQRTPLYVQLAGAHPVGPTPSATDTVLIWQGPQGAAVLDIQHAQCITIKDLRIEAAAGCRFRYGLLFHRVHSAISGTSVAPPPTALSILGVAIGPGAGAFTVGVRLNDASSAAGAIDQNVDHAFVEDLWIEGATPEPQMPSAGLWIDGSQVQGQLLRNLSIRRCGIGIFLQAGQLQLVGGTFADNVLPSHPCGGGDLVFRSGYRAGHLVKDVACSGSFRFYTSYYEGPSENDLQHDQPVALALVGCDVESLHPSNLEGDAIYQRGAGGPLFIGDCRLGRAGGRPLHVRVGQHTRGTVVLANCTFNHDSPPIRVNPGDFSGQVVQLGCRGASGPLPDLPAATPVPSVPHLVLRTRADAPSIHKRSMNVLELGVRGDDLSVDNAPRLQRAIDALGTQGGGTLYFPPGLYALRTSLRIQDTRGIRLLGAGGRQGAVDLGGGRYIGSGLVWNGPEAGPGSVLLQINRAQDIVIEGLGFSPYARPGEGMEGAETLDTMIAVSGPSTSGIWLEDLGAGWRGGATSSGRGFAKTFLALRRVGGAVTLRRCAIHQAEEQAVLVEEASDVQLLLFIAAACKRAVRIQGGALAWVGGGGNAAGQFADPVVVQLDKMSGPLVLAAREVQDDHPACALRGGAAGDVYLYGDHQYLPIPQDRRLIDCPAAQVHLYGCGLGFPEDQAIEVHAKQLFALGNLFPKERPWRAAQVVDLGSRSEHVGVPWPLSVRALEPFLALARAAAPAESRPRRPRAAERPKGPAPAPPPAIAAPVPPAPSAAPILLGLAAGVLGGLLLFALLRRRPDGDPSAVATC